LPIPTEPTDAFPRKISNDELFEIARLIVAPSRTDPSTIEWTTQLTLRRPLFLAMNANWDGVLGLTPWNSEVTRRSSADEQSARRNWQPV